MVIFKKKNMRKEGSKVGRREREGGREGGAKEVELDKFLFWTSEEMKITRRTF